jgi:antitoxin component of RelBE/YafQ-DinJ toxin-antitoxin module
MNIKNTNQSRITIDISKDIHKQLKTIAAIKGKSMRTIVIESIEKYLYSENIPNKQTLKAIKKAEEGKDLFKAKNIKDLFKKLGI